jgi:hypothetical protein
MFLDRRCLDLDRRCLDLDLDRRFLHLDLDLQIPFHQEASEHDVITPLLQE